MIKRWVWVMALAAMLWAAARPAAATDALFQPHYDFNTTGQYWALSSTTENAVMPRVVRLAYDAAGYYYPSATGAYLVFPNPTDAARVATLLADINLSPSITNMAASFRAAEPGAAAINHASRWTNYFLIRYTTSGEIHFSPTDYSSGRVIWHAANTAFGTAGIDYLTYNQALKRYYAYEETGVEAIGEDNRLIVPLRYIGANLNATWVSPSDGGTKSGLCYITRERIAGKFVDVPYACYKPTTYDDPAATRFLILSETFYGTAAEELNNNKIALSTWRTTRLAEGDTLNGAGSYYCQAVTMEVWGDAPYNQWGFNTSKQPLKDTSGTAPVPIYGGTIGGPTSGCTSGSPGAFTVGVAPPSDAHITNDLNSAMLRAQGVDAGVGNSVDEFVLPPVPGGNPRIDAFVKMSINGSTDHAWWCDYFVRLYPAYLCPVMPTWPGVIGFNNPWYGGYYDHLYYDYLPDSDGDGLVDAVEGRIGTDPGDSDSDNDGLEDGDEYYTYDTDPTGWDTDGDALPDGYEVENLDGHTEGMTLDPLVKEGDTADFDHDGNLNVHEYWNGTDYRVKDPKGGEGCYYWGDATGDGFIGALDITILTSRIKGPVDYSRVIPDTGETQDLDDNGFWGAVDTTLLTAFAKSESTEGIATRPNSIEKLSSATASVQVGNTTHLTVALRNAHGTFTVGFGVVFSIDPSSTGTAVILGGDGANPLGYRYDMTGAKSISARSNVVILVKTAGTIKINAGVPQCGLLVDRGRYCAALSMAEPFIITGY